MEMQHEHAVEMLFQLHDADEQACVLAIVRSLVAGQAVVLTDRDVRFAPHPDALELLLSPQLFVRLSGACRSQAGMLRVDVAIHRDIVQFLHGNLASSAFNREVARKAAVAVHLVRLLQSLEDDAWPPVQPWVTRGGASARTAYQKEVAALMGLLLVETLSYHTACADLVVLLPALHHSRRDGWLQPLLVKALTACASSAAAGLHITDDAVEPRCWFDLSAPGCAGLQLTLPSPWPVNGAFTVLLWFCLEALPAPSAPPSPPTSSPFKWWAKREPPGTPLARLYGMQLDEGDDGFSSVELFVSGDGALVVHSQQADRGRPCMEATATARCANGLVRPQHWHCVVAVHDAPNARVQLIVDNQLALDAPLSRQQSLAGATGVSVRLAGAATHDTTGRAVQALARLGTVALLSGLATTATAATIHTLSAGGRPLAPPATTVTASAGVAGLEAMLVLDARNASNHSRQFCTTPTSATEVRPLTTCVADMGGLRLLLPLFLQCPEETLPTKQASPLQPPLGTGLSSASYLQVFRAMPALLAECHEPDSEAARALAALLEAAPAEVRSTANFATALQHMAALITVSIPDWLQALAPSLTALVPGLPPPSPVLSAAANDAAALDRTLTELARRPGPWQQPVPDDGCTTASEHAHEQPRETEEPRGTEVPPRVVDAVKHHSGIAIERVLIPCGEPTQSLWTVGGDGLLRCHRIEWVEPANPFDTTVPSPLFTAAQTTVCTPLVSAYLDGPCVTIARLPSAHWIITGGFWDGAVLATVPGVTRLLTKRSTEPSPVTAVAADGANLAIGDAGGVLSVCDLNHRWPARPRRMAAAHLTAVTSVALHVGADLLVAGDAMGRCTVHRFSTGAFLAELALRGVGRERATVRHVVIAGDGSVAAALHGTDDSSCVLQSWSAAGGEWVRHGSMRLASVVCGMTDTTSGLLVVCRSSAALRCIKTLGVLRALAVPPVQDIGGRLCCASAANGNVFAGTGNGMVLTWKL